MTEVYYATNASKVYYLPDGACVVMDWLDYNTSDNFRTTTVKAVSILKFVYHKFLLSEETITNPKSVPKKFALGIYDSKSIRTLLY
jgi:hypothetical protein